MHIRPVWQIGLFIVTFSVVLVAWVAVNAVICYFVSECYKRIPKQFRQMQPTLVWLSLIPIFNLVWNFFVFPKLSASFKAYFDSVGGRDLGNAGRGMALAYCICAACMIIPCVALPAVLGALVLLILYLVEAYKLKSLISAS